MLTEISAQRQFESSVSHALHTVNAGHVGKPALYRSSERSGTLR